MKNKTLVIIEDEAHNSRLLQSFIEELRPDWKNEAILESIEESVAWLKTNKAPHLILMDIQLSDGICFSIFDKVDLPASCRIIFTTAYDEYAIRAFKVNSIDYLLKPIEKHALEKSFLKYDTLVKNEKIAQNKIDYTQLAESILRGNKKYRTRFLTSGVNSFQKIDTKDIAYFYSENKITFAINNKGVEHTLDYTLEHIESELNPAEFYRANRKTIINIDSISKITNNLSGKLQIIIHPKPNFEILVSREKASDLKKWAGK